MKKDCFEIMSDEIEDMLNYWWFDCNPMKLFIQLFFIRKSAEPTARLHDSTAMQSLLNGSYFEQWILITSLHLF